MLHRLRVNCETPSRGHVVQVMFLRFLSPFIARQTHYDQYQDEKDDIYQNIAIEPNFVPYLNLFLT